MGLKNYLRLACWILAFAVPLSSTASAQELSATFSEEFAWGHLSGSSEDFQARNVRGINAQLFLGLPIPLPWLGIAPGIFLEKRFQWQDRAGSLLGDRDSIADGFFWGFGSSLSVKKILLQGALIVGGSSDLSSSNSSPLPSVTDQLSLASPFGIRMRLGYSLFSSVFLHLSYHFNEFRSLDYPQSIDPLSPKTVQKELHPAIQENTLGLGISVVY